LSPAVCTGLQSECGRRCDGLVGMAVVLKLCITGTYIEKNTCFDYLLQAMLYTVIIPIKVITNNAL